MWQKLRSFLFSILKSFFFQDQELNETKQLYQIIQQKYTNQEKEIGEMKDLIQQLKDKNALLKAQKGMNLHRKNLSATFSVLCLT